LENEKAFMENIYYEVMRNVEVVQPKSVDREMITDFSKLLENLADQTNRIKSIIEEIMPHKENDLPILQYHDTSEYIIHGFESNDKMTGFEIFTEKWDRYTKERGSKEMYKECLNNEYKYFSNRVPQLLTSQFMRVKNAKEKIRVKVFLTIFVPVMKIE
jgi:hypothetical protein